MRLEMLRDPSLKFQKYFIRSLSLGYRTRTLGEAKDLQTAFEGIIENTTAKLDCIGDHEMYFTCEFSAGLTDLWMFGNHYQTLSGWLSKMPNLKWFKFIHLLSFHWDHGYPHSFGPLDDLTPPELTKLERLDLKLCLGNMEATHICAKFLSMWPHVQILNDVGRRRKHILARSEKEFPLLDFALRMKTLKSLGALSVDGCSNFLGDMNLLVTICERNWKLQRLDLKLDMKSKPVLGAFEALQNLQSLKKLRLNMENARIGKSTTCIRLPHFTHFELIVNTEQNFRWNEPSYPFFFSLQFLVFVKKLNSLVWNCTLRKIDWETLDQNLVVTSDGMIQFGGGRIDIAKSNIWRVFPWLVKLNMELVEVVELESNREENVVKKEFCKGELVLAEETTRKVPVRRIHVMDIEADRVLPALRPLCFNFDD